MMMKTHSLCSLLLVLSFLVVLVPSAQARDLYVAEVPLEGQAAVAGADLLQALDQVLVRLTGKVDESPVAALGLRPTDVNQLLVSQQRVRVTRLDAEGESQDLLHLRAEFYPQAVDQLIDRQGWPRLGRERPAILLWASLDALDADAALLDDPLVEQAIDEQARRLGLDVFRPLGDALDLAEVQLADIRGGFLDAAETGAERYGAGVIAMLDLRQEGDHWTARWFWRLDGRDSGLNLSADEPGELVAPGLEAILTALATRYGSRRGAGQASVRRVVLEGMVDEIQYAEVVRELGGLSVVNDLRLIRAHQRQLEFELVLGGSGLEDLIALSRLLTVDRQAANGDLILRLAR